MKMVAVDLTYKTAIKIKKTFMKNLKTLPEIHTPRLVLRKIEESDAEVILFLRTDETVNKYIQRPASRQIKNISDALNHIRKLHNNTEENRSFAWGMTLKNSPDIMGTICLWNFSKDHKKAEVGYDLNPKFQRKGYMSEALKTILHFGFKELDLNLIEAFTHYQNTSSIKLLEKHGFKLNSSKKDQDNSANLVFDIKSV